MKNVQVIVLTGASTENWEAAAQHAIQDAPTDLGEIISADVIHQSACVEKRQIVEYRVTLNVSYFDSEIRDPEIELAIEA